MCAEGAKSLGQKVKDWFDSEGYPLEFRVARAFEEHGFDPHQGHYIVDESENQAREIDLVADIGVHSEDIGLFRVSQVIGCKWSRDKPWVVFTGRRSIMAESACIAQTIGSLVGEAVMFCLAGDRSLHSLELFKCPERGGFSGRRAFEKHENDKYDQFYRTVQGVVNAAMAEARRYDIPKPREHEVPRSGAIIFPVVVINGNLFEAYYDVQTNEVRVSEVDKLRIFWRGAKTNRRPITPIDVVTANAVGDFARTRASEINTFLTAAEKAIGALHLAFREGKFESLRIQRAPRGFVGLPPLLRDLYMLEQDGKASRQPGE